MEWQLRIYTIDDGAMEEWIEDWRSHVAPLRRGLGFRVLGPWVDDDNTFVWLLGYDGEDGFAAADTRYYEAPERRNLSPDPARHIAKAEHRPLRDLGPIE